MDEGELSEIESNAYEHCLKLFFQQCDLNKDRVLSLKETCRCFTDEPPCTEALKLFTPVMKKFAPKCDEDGFYQP
ncbi:hypothetical protein, partial [Salmonella sp. s54925]|uniref:hypothetical protein n=1 Tax=Salmonella sp. s54925 TaxID=3159674 RepID=UPI003980DEAE